MFFGMVGNNNTTTLPDFFQPHPTTRKPPLVPLGRGRKYYLQTKNTKERSFESLKKFYRIALILFIFVHL